MSDFSDYGHPIGRVIPVDGDLGEYFAAEKRRRDRDLARIQWQRVKVAVTANMRPMIEGFKRVGRMVEDMKYKAFPLIWAEDYKDDLGESWGEVEDVFI